FAFSLPSFFFDATVSTDVYIFPYTTLFRSLARIGLHLDTSLGAVAGRGAVWPVAAGVALGCALAVTVPALTSSFAAGRARPLPRSEEHTSELQSRENLVCRLLLEKKKIKTI